MIPHLGDAVCGLLRLLTITILISVPLAIWKLIDIIIWICHHVKVGLT